MIDPEKTSTQLGSPAGFQLGPYRVETPIGAGGMGTVYRAVDTRLGRTVAVKTTKATYTQRFMQEARAISSLNHPNICSLYDVGPDYLVMEFIQGETLAVELAKGPMPIALAVRYGIQIAGALAEAHAHGIIHRDLKPSNIMLTAHGVKVLDFGLAKTLTGDGLTETNAILGTPAYMSPEQVRGQPATGAADLFALGLVLYEMCVGKLPFPGESLGLLLSRSSQTAIPATSKLAPELSALIMSLLQEDPARRPQSAAEVARTLSSIADHLNESASPNPSRKPIYLAALLVLILIVVGTAWFFLRSQQRTWVREEAIPQISNLATHQPLAAFTVLRKAEAIEPQNPDLRKLAQSQTHSISVSSTPPGATIEIQDYAQPASWFPLGSTPLQNVRVPNGYFRWKVSKPGMPDFLSAPETRDQMQFTLASQQTSPPMDPVPAGERGDMIDFVGWFIYNLPAFDVDRYEVTNKQYQEFVDHGGYQNRSYWNQKFVRNGKELTWEQALSQFRDPTGRYGPATWEGGHFPQGQADYPVSGVSWYEASAYAAYAGKSLPALVQWYTVAPPERVVSRINQSNFNGKGPVPVGTFPGVGPYGTYDLNGNVREWCLNAVDGDSRFILGGAWGTQTYQAYDPEALPPFDRSPLNGFRCVRSKGPLPPDAAAPVVRKGRDFTKSKPVSDEVFNSLRLMYAYDHLPVSPKSDGIVESTADWTKEKVTIDAGYGNERLPLFLFLPKNVKPPYETVLFFPSARVISMPSSDNLGDMEFVDYVIKSGRALVYPIYTGTYERVGSFILPGDIRALNRVIQQSKEVERSVDYLETRADIDKTKLAYLGVSQGSAYGVIFAALEPRFKTAIFLDGGFFLSPTLPAEDQVNFAPRLKMPVLMVNGRYDFTFSLDRAQETMFRMIATPPADKRHIVLETPHNISQDKPKLSKGVLDWLDRYLGRIN